MDLLDDGIYSLLTVQTAAEVLNVLPRWLGHRLDNGEASKQAAEGKRRYLHRDEVPRLTATCNLAPAWERALDKALEA